MEVEHEGNIKVGTGWLDTLVNDATVLYDSSGVTVCYKNGTAIVNDGGNLVSVYGYAGWKNSTFGAAYLLYYDTGGENVVYYSDIYLMGNEGLDGFVTGTNDFNAWIFGSLGLIAILSVLIVGVAIASLRFFGSGMSEIGVSAVYKGTAYFIIWMIFSVFALPFFTAMEASGIFLGTITFFIFTSIYTLGVINTTGIPDHT
jgi:hypothetical protein